MKKDAKEQLQGILEKLDSVRLSIIHTNEKDPVQLLVKISQNNGYAEKELLDIREELGDLIDNI